MNKDIWLSPVFFCRSQDKTFENYDEQTTFVISCCLREKENEILVYNK